MSPAKAAAKVRRLAEQLQMAIEEAAEVGVETVVAGAWVDGVFQMDVTTKLLLVDK